MRIWRHVLSNLGSGQAVAALVFVRVLVEMRHFRRRPSARDHLDQLLAGERGLVQIGSLSWGAWIAASIPIRPVAELAVCLVLIDTLGERWALRAGRIDRHGERNHGAHSESARSKPAKPFPLVTRDCPHLAPSVAMLDNPLGLLPQLDVGSPVTRS